MRKVITEKREIKKWFWFQKSTSWSITQSRLSVHVLKGCALNILNPTILNSEFSLNYVNI